MKTGFNIRVQLQEMLALTQAATAEDAANTAFLARAEARFGGAAPELAANQDLTI